VGAAEGARNQGVKVSCEPDQRMVNLPKADPSETGTSSSSTFTTYFTANVTTPLPATPPELAWPFT
jgi:hypothetical protein